MAVKTVRICDRCGEPENRLRRLSTIGDFLDLIDASEGEEERDQLGRFTGDQVYCVARTCIVTAIFQLAMVKLNEKRSGRGIARVKLENLPPLPPPPRVRRRLAAEAAAAAATVQNGRGASVQPHNLTTEQLPSGNVGVIVREPRRTPQLASDFTTPLGLPR